MRNPARQIYSESSRLSRASCFLLLAFEDVLLFVCDKERFQKASKTFTGQDEVVWFLHSVGVEWFCPNTD